MSGIPVPFLRVPKQGCAGEGRAWSAGREDRTQGSCGQATRASPLPLVLFLLPCYRLGSSVRQEHWKSSSASPVPWHRARGAGQSVPPCLQPTDASLLLPSGPLLPQAGPAGVLASEGCWHPSAAAAHRHAGDRPARLTCSGHARWELLFLMCRLSIQNGGLMLIPWRAAVGAAC